MPPTVIIVLDTSLRMLEDGNGNFYDPNFYKVSDDLAVMPAFPNIDTVTTKTYRRTYTNLQYASSGQVLGGLHHRDGGGVGSGEPADVERRRRRRLSRSHPLQHCEARRRGSGRVRTPAAPSAGA